MQSFYSAMSNKITQLAKSNKTTLRLSYLVPPQGVAFIASGGIVAGIFVSNSPLTDTVF